MKQPQQWPETFENVMAMVLVSLLAWLLFKSWGKSPKDPSLSPEQRAEVVRGHAAIRNRARAFGVLNLTIQRQRDELGRLKQELEQFKQSVPKADGSQPAPANGQSHDPWSALEQRLSGYAK